METTTYDITVERCKAGTPGRCYTLVNRPAGETWPHVTRTQAHDILGAQWGVRYIDRCALLDGFLSGLNL